MQVETIGDAYCVAGGLHKESDTHAFQIALMALKMMELSDEVMSPHGEPIKVRQITCCPGAVLRVNAGFLFLKRMVRQSGFIQTATSSLYKQEEIYHMGFCFLFFVGWFVCFYGHICNIWRF